MDESTPIRAIVIGVSVLIGIATISAVLMYYNTAKQMASNVGRGQDFASNYEQNIKDILLKGSYTVSGNNYITGTDVKNLLNYFYNDESVEITVQNIRYIEKYEGNRPICSSTSTACAKANSTSYSKAMSIILSDQKFLINVEENVQISNDKIGTKIVMTGIF